jgi:HD-like signal output (HDOD) protein
MVCLDARTFWTTNAKRACLARAIAKRLHPATQLEAFTAGLLQDMAIPVLISAKKNDYCVALETWNSDPESDLAQIEKNTFGFDHQAVGGLMAEEWNFPGYLQEAIGQHHSLNGTGQMNIDRAIIAVSSLRYPSGEYQDRDDEMLKTMLREVLGVGEQVASEIVAQAESDAHQVAEIFY